MGDELIQKLDVVCDEASFVAFLAALAADREDEIRKEKIKPSSPHGPGSNGWENPIVETFLGQAVIWADASVNGLRYYEKPQNPWKRCADILYAGKIYE